MDELTTFLNELTVLSPLPIERNPVYSTTILSNHTKRRLLDYQIKNVVKIINILLKKRIALDGSDTGIGKTYMALAACRELKKRAIIFCPKTLMYNWLEVAKQMEVQVYDIVNFETIKNGKSYVRRRVRENGILVEKFQFNTRRKAEYLTVVAADNLQNDIYRWDLPQDCMVIIDEAHRCKDPKTDNGKFMKSFRSVITRRIPVLLLSATICEDVQDMKIPFYLFGMIDETREFNGYFKQIIEKNNDLKVSKKTFADHPSNKQKQLYEEARELSYAMMIHREIKDYFTRLKIKDLGDKFPENQWSAQLFNTESTEEITKMYDMLVKKLKEMKKYPGGNQLAEIMKLKQEIEFKKIPIFIEQAKEYMLQGKSVIIFVNFLTTLKVLAHELNANCMIYGGRNRKHQNEEENDESEEEDDDENTNSDSQDNDDEEFAIYDKNGKIMHGKDIEKLLDIPDEEETTTLPPQTLEERMKAIRLFQENKERLILCQIRTGSVGISLQDLDGRYPRVTLINYPDTATHLLQAMGRAWRAGGKSPVLQRIVLAANVPYEEKIKKNIDKRLKNVSMINDGKGDSYDYNVEIMQNKLKKQKKKTEVV